MHEEKVIGVAIAGVALWYYYNQKEDRQTSQRAATNVIPPQEKPDMGRVEPTYTRPITLPPRGIVASSLNSFQYYPVLDTAEGSYEDQIKSLNIANRFLYG